MSNEVKRILFLVILLFFMGITGYSLIEDWNLMDSLYMTVITLSTTGYKEVYPLSNSGRILTMVLIIFGITVFLYALREFNLLIFEGKFFQERKMEKLINQLDNHYIICGFGRMGTKIAQELHARKTPFVILEKDLDNPEQVGEYQYISGDATEDENLLKAGITRARGLVSVLRSEIANTYTTLSARGLNPSLKIIARAEDESSKEKLIKAGADRVVLPYEIGGWSEFNTIIVGRYRSSGKLIYNPLSDTLIEQDDNLIVIGKREKLDKLQVKANEK